MDILEIPEMKLTKRKFSARLLAKKQIKVDPEDANLNLDYISINTENIQPKTKSKRESRSKSSIPRRSRSRSKRPSQSIPIQSIELDLESRSCDVPPSTLKDCENDNSNSRTKADVFLDSLELKPVFHEQSKVDASCDTTRKSKDGKIKILDKKIRPRTGIMSKRSKKGRKMLKRSQAQIQEVQTAYCCNKSSYSEEMSTVSEEKVRDSLSQKESAEVKVMEDMKGVDWENRTSQVAQVNGCKVITFRDVNRKITVDADGASLEEPENNDYLSQVHASTMGRKRRYAKLMKKLEDAEKSLETNLKEVVDSLDSNDADKDEPDQSIEKIKEKLCVRAKKKYESLINYQKGQSKEEEKSFMDLLPEKVEQVKANIVKQLVFPPDKMVVKKKRGRPRKFVPICEERKVTPPKKKREQSSPKNKRSKSRSKVKESAENRGFPLKFPKSLLRDNYSRHNQCQYKPEKIRLGIVKEDGEREIVELSRDMLKGLNSPGAQSEEPCITSLHKDSVSQTSGETELCGAGDNSIFRFLVEDDEKNRQRPSSLQEAECCDEQHNCPTGKDEGSSNISQSTSDVVLPLESWIKSPPTTITLPSISSLENDFELVSLSPSKPAKIGDLKRDQFYIPQSSFLKEGKTSMIMVGPFLVVSEPKPHLVLVQPEKREKGPTMVLRRKIHSPSNTPPRDFRIGKEQGPVRSEPKAVYKLIGGKEGNPRTALLDHDYCTPPEFRDRIKRYCKGLAKQSANARFIDVRLESITEKAGQSVVTLKGDNVLRQVKNLANPATAPMHNTEEGIPLIYNLSQIMTSALRWAEEKVQREKLVEESRLTGDYTPVMFPYNVMGDVVMEVLIPPGGTEYVPPNRLRKAYESLGTSSTRCLSWREKNKCKKRSLAFMALNTSLCLRLAVQPVSDLPSENSQEKTLGNDVPFYHSKNCINVEESSPQLGRNQKDIELERDVESTQTLEDKEEIDIPVVVENEASVNAGPRRGLACCRLCLRLFPSGYALFLHVRSVHSSCEANNTVYLEELKIHSRLACPVCFSPPVFLNTPHKLRRHMEKYHRLLHHPHICKFCHMEFLEKQELAMHMELNHGAYIDSYQQSSMISLLKPGRINSMRRNMNCQRSLLSDYISCSRCNIVFSDRASLIAHTLTMHPELNQQHLCRLCHREFDSDCNLRKHLKNSHEQTRSGALRCPFCPAWLPDMESAAEHKTSLHSSGVPVHCPFCGAGYQTLHPMYSHVRSQHLQTEVHLCPECHESFPNVQLLTEHAQKDHMISPHVMMGDLRNTKNTSYCCPFCTTSFLRTYDLAVHVVNAHRAHLLPAKCHWCMQSFVNTTVMKIHMSGAHGVSVGHPEDRTSASYLEAVDQSEDSSNAPYVDSQFMEDGGVTVVLEEVEQQELYGPQHHALRSHLLEPRDILETQEAASFIQDLEDRDGENIVYLNDQSQVIDIPGGQHGAGEVFEEVQLLGSSGEDFNLHGVDYLETLSNDSIAVAADVVADVMDISDGRGVDSSQVGQVEDMLGLTGQFEVDGVLYEFSTAHDGPMQDLGSAGELVTIDASSLRDPGDQITINANDFTHLFRQVQ